MKLGLLRLNYILIGAILLDFAILAAVIELFRRAA